MSKTPPDPRQPSFWSEEEKRLWDELAPSLIEIVFAGGMSGHEALPASAQVLVNWDVYNQKAIDYLYQYRLSTVYGINETSRKQAISAIEAWIKGGETLDTLEARLGPTFGKTRAGQIAVTEVTRLYAKGNQAAWEASGVVGSNRWNTAVDERVCPYCGPLEGKIVALGSGFYSLGIAAAAPPLHPRCRCWLTPVVDERLFREQLRQAFGVFGTFDDVETRINSLWLALPSSLKA
jgi:SPP1 gp7 family putative phage head morphogenesis protein